MSQLLFILLSLACFCNALGQGAPIVASGNIIGQNYGVSYIIGDPMFIEIGNDIFSIAPANIPVNSNQVITGITDESMEVTFFPNPFIDKLFTNRQGIQQIELLDSKGMELMKAPFNDGEFDASSLPAGMYYIRFFDGTSSKTYKIIKHGH